MSTALATPAFDLTQPFTRAAGLEAGLSWGVLKGPLFRKVLHGVYISARAPRRELERLEAALLIHPAGAYATHTSAARVYGLPVPSRLTDEHVTVFHRKDRRSPRGVRSHLAPELARVVSMHGVPVSSPEQLFIQLAGLLNLVELVVVGDALVRWHPITPAALVQAAAASHDRHARAARRAASYVRPDVDSPMETRLRMLIVLAGLPEPVVNFKVLCADGRLRYRFDLSYPDLKLIVEYDGRQHRDDFDQWDRDIERDDWFDHAGWMIVRVFARGIYKEPGKTVDRVRKALLSLGGEVPRRLSEDWRPFFPTI